MLANPITSFFMYCSILSVVLATAASLSPKIPNSIGEPNDGPPSSGVISTIIPGILVVASSTRSIIS